MRVQSTKLLISLFLLGIPLYTHAAHTPHLKHRVKNTDLKGIYNCVGTTPWATQYKIKLEIQKGGQAYIFKWQTSKGLAFIGAGLLHKGVNGSLAANFWDVSNAEAIPGIVIYQIQGNGILKGNWMITNQPAIGTEVCKKEAHSSSAQKEFQQNFPPTMPNNPPENNALENNNSLEGKYI
jgi:hypothetical protein